MIKVRPGAGYTVVEVMIFLAVSGALLVAATLTIAGQQSKTEFTQAIRETNSQIQDIINDVATGYYPSSNNFSCTAPGSNGQPVINEMVPQSQGTNQDCIFIGRVIQFAPAGTNEEGFYVYTVVGRRQAEVSGVDKEVGDYSQAEPKVVDIITERKKLSGGLKAKKMYYNNPANVLGATGLFSTFGGYTGTGDLISGSQAVNLEPIPGTDIGQSEADTITQITDLKTVALATNPSDGVIICFESAGTQQHGLITIGGGGRQLSTKLEIRGGTCP